MDKIDKNTICGYLKNIHLFSALNKEQIENISQSCVSKNYKSGETIFKEKEVGNSVYIIASGEVRIHKSVATDNPIHLATLKENSLFGELSLITDIPRSATAIANNDVGLIEVPASTFMNVIMKDKSVALNFIHSLAKMICERLVSLDEQFTKHMQSCPLSKDAKIKEYQNVHDKLFSDWPF